MPENSAEDDVHGYISGLFRAVEYGLVTAVFVILNVMWVSHLFGIIQKYYMTH